jgi:hypothetical protein
MINEFMDGRICDSHILQWSAYLKQDFMFREVTISNLQKTFSGWSQTILKDFLRVNLWCSKHILMIFFLLGDTKERKVTIAIISMFFLLERFIRYLTF